MNIEECIRELHRRYEEQKNSPEPRNLNQFLERHADVLSRLSGDERDLARQRFVDERQLLDGFDIVFTPEANAPQTFRIEDVGEFCGGRYEVREIYDTGGLGVILLAHDKELNREVAVKAIRPEHQRSPLDRKRFEREAAITGALEHPGIVPLYGFGADPQGRSYYVMKFVHGEKFSQTIGRFHEDHLQFPMLTETSRMDALRKLLSDLVRVCETIAFAHSRNIIHRDIKPDNIRVGQFGEVLVLDWGLAKSTDMKSMEAETEMLGGTAADQGLTTKVGSGVGTPLFMSPEQASGLQDVGTPSDIYSLGATLYHILTGKFGVNDRSKAIKQEVIAGNIIPPRLRDPAIPRALEAICLKAMAREPAARYISATDLAQDLKNWLAHEPVSAWKEPWLVQTQRWVRRHKTFATGVAAAMSMAMVALSITMIVLSYKDAELQSANADLRSSLYQSQVAYADSTLREGEQDFALTILQGCPEAERGPEWNHLRRVLGKPRDLLGDRLEGVTLLEVSPDGLLVGAAGPLPLEPGAGGPTGLFVFDVKSGKQIQAFRFGQIAPYEMSFSPDSRLVALSGRFNPQNDYGVRVYEIKTGNLIWSADEDPQERTSAGFVGFDDVGNFFTTSGPNDGNGWNLDTWTLHHWKGEDGSPIAQLPTNDPRKDFLRVWTLEEGSVQVRRRLTDEVVRRLPANLSDGRTLGLASDSDLKGQTVILATRDLASATNWVRIWPDNQDEAGNANQWWSWPHEGPIRAVALSDDGTRAASATQQYLRVWDVKQRRLFFKIASRYDDMATLRFADGNQTLVAAGPRSGVQTWQIADPPFSTLTTISSPKASKYCLNPKTGLIYIAQSYGIVQVWDVTQQAMIKQLDLASQGIRQVRDVVSNRDGTLLAIAHEDPLADEYPRRVTLVDLLSEKAVGEFEMSNPVAFVLDDSQLLSVQMPRNLIETLTQDIVPFDKNRFSKATLDRFRAKNPWKLRNLENASQDENRNVIVEDLGEHNFWMVDDLYKRANGFLQVASLSDIQPPDSAGKTVRSHAVFDSGQIPEPHFSRIVTNPLGVVLAIEGKDGIQIGPVPGAEIFPNLDPSVARKTWSAKNRNLLNEREQKLLEQNLTAVESEKEGSRFEYGKVLLRHPDGRQILPLAFSHDTRLFVASVADQSMVESAVQDRPGKCTIRIWDTGSWEHWDLTGHTDWITDAVFSSNGTRLFTASSDGTVKLWHVQTGNLLATFRDAQPANPTLFSPQILSLGLTEDESWLIAHAVDTSNPGERGRPGEVLLRWDLRPFSE